MPNQITNASGLDGVTNWNGPGVAVDELTLGAPNRRAIKAGATLSAGSVNLDGAAGAYVFSHYAGSSLRVVWLDGVGQVGAALVVPDVSRSSRAARRGIASTFHFARGFMPKPVGATRFSLYVDGPNAAVFRPYGMATSATADRPQGWTPGPHINPDLALPSWPEFLRPPSPDSIELEPIALRKGFSGDSGIPTTRRVAAISRRFIRFDLVLDAIGRDLLDQFWRANHAEFWFVRPDNGDLCVAEWADDGDPKDNGWVPGGRRTSVRLLLRDS